MPGTSYCISTNGFQVVMLQKCRILELGGCTVLKTEVWGTFNAPFLLSCPGSSSVFSQLIVPHPLSYDCIVLFRGTFSNYPGSYQPHPSMNRGVYELPPTPLGLHCSLKLHSSCLCHPKIQVSHLEGMPHVYSSGASRP